MSVWHQQENRSISYYEILNITQTADDDEIRSAYKSMALRFHPDRNPKNRAMSEHRFRLIKEAYERIKTHERRESYNRLLMNADKRVQAANSNAQQQNNPSFFDKLSSFLIGEQVSDRMNKNQ